MSPSKRPSFDERRTITPSEAHIALGSDGFVVQCDDEIIADVQWIAVQTIFAYTRFIDGHGSLCLAFVLPPGPRGREDQVVVNEGVKGWEQLVSCMPSAFPSMDVDWVKEASCDPSQKGATEAIARVVSRHVANPTLVWPRL
jgi:hypothetical protein